MPTTVTRSIGSAGGRDYSTLQAWEDAVPADLVSADEEHVGECYNDSEFLDTSFGGIILTIDGHTTDTARAIILTAAAGQSFQDHVDVRTNALRYDQSKGVGLRQTSNYGQCIRSLDTSVRIGRLQCKVTHATAADVIFSEQSHHHSDLILEHGGASNRYCLEAGGFSTIVNVLGVKLTNGVAFHDFGSSGSSIIYIGCTAVRPTDLSAHGTGFASQYADGHTLESCAVFGFLAADSNGKATGSSNNASDLASGLPGASNQHSVTYSQFTPFTDADKDSMDWRAIAATALAANGVLDATNAPNDISGAARAASPTIGHWELLAAAAVGAKIIFRNRLYV